MSMMSFPDRGPWGKSSWRGNCSGHVYKELFERLRPAVFVDPMVGSGTSVDVAKEMGIEAYGLDLHHGFNAIRNSIAAAVGKPADLVVSQATLNRIYDAVAQAAPSKLATNTAWQEKIQQTLNNNPVMFRSVARGEWAIA